MTKCCSEQSRTSGHCARNLIALGFLISATESGNERTKAAENRFPDLTPSRPHRLTPSIVERLKHLRGRNSVSNESDASVHSRDAETARIRADEERALVKECMDWERNNVILRFGQGVLALAENDEELLAYMASGEPELQSAAINALIRIRYLFHPRLVEMCAEYLRTWPPVGV